MTLSSPRRPPLPWLETWPGLALAWPHPPIERPAAAAPPRTARAWRARALAKAFAGQGQRDLLAERPPLREITLEGTETLDVRTLAGLLATLREGAEPPLIRIARHWPDPFLPELAAGKWNEDSQGPPPFLHGIVHDPGALEGAWIDALDRLAEEGVPLSAEVWLTRVGNDDLDRLRALLRRLVALRARPYFLIDGEWLPPELRVPEARALELVRGLRGWISGLAVPQLVREDGRMRRAPVVPDYIEAMEKDRVTVRNYAGRVHRYENPRGGGPDADQRPASGSSSSSSASWSSPGLSTSSPSSSSSSSPSS